MQVFRLLNYPFVKALPTGVFQLMDTPGAYGTPQNHFKNTTTENKKKISEFIYCSVAFVFFSHINTVSVDI